MLQTFPNPLVQSSFYEVAYLFNKNSPSMFNVTGTGETEVKHIKSRSSEPGTKEHNFAICKAL